MNKPGEISINKVEIIEQEGLIVIFRGVEFGKMENTLKALYEGGVRIIEIAFNPSDSQTIQKTYALIKEARRVMGDKMLIGAGTVICEEYVVAAYEAGSDFIFSPDTDLDVIRLTKKLGMVSIPGALTPTECKTAYQNGADIIKLFPATINDIDYITGITRPLSHIPFICVGGTNENTIEAFIKAGAKAVGTGISILKPELVENGNYAEITALAKLHIDKIKEARNEA